MKTFVIDKPYYDYVNYDENGNFRCRVVGEATTPTMSQNSKICYRQNWLGEVATQEEFDPEEDKDLIKKIFNAKTNQTFITRFYNKGDSMSVLILLYNKKGAVVASDSREFFGDNFEYHYDSKQKVYKDKDFLLGQMGVNLYFENHHSEDTLNNNLYEYLKENKDKTAVDFFKAEKDGITYKERFDKETAGLNQASNIMYVDKKGKIGIYNIIEGLPVKNYANSLPSDVYVNIAKEYQDKIREILSRKNPNNRIEGFSVEEMKNLAKEIIEELLLYAKDEEEKTHKAAKIGGEIQVEAIEFENIG